MMRGMPMGRGGGGRGDADEPSFGPGMGVGALAGAMGGPSPYGGNTPYGGGGALGMPGRFGTPNLNGIDPKNLPDGVKIIDQCDFMIQFVLQPIPRKDRDAKAAADASGTPASGEESTGEKPAAPGATEPAPAAKAAGH